MKCFYLVVGQDNLRFFEKNYVYFLRGNNFSFFFFEMIKNSLSLKLPQQKERITNCLIL